MAKEKPAWKMPDWMEPYRGSFANTGGNSIEELMNDRTTDGGNNIIRSALIIAVESQVILLNRLHHEGRLAAKGA
jgi:hypothetical protein